MRRPKKPIQLNKDGSLKITENDVKKSIKDLLDSLQIFNFHLMAGMGSYDGAPDRMALTPNICPVCGRAGAIAIECKSPTGTQSDYQIRFEERWTRAGGIYILARGPSDVSKALGLPLIFS